VLVQCIAVNIVLGFLFTIFKKTPYKCLRLAHRHASHLKTLHPLGLRKGLRCLYAYTVQNINRHGLVPRSLHHYENPNVNNTVMLYLSFYNCNIVSILIMGIVLSRLT